jgi:hypothetical protein
MKKRTKNIIFIIIGILVLLFLFRTIYKNFDFEKDKQTFLALISKAGSGKVVGALDEMRELESITNPIINFQFQSWKKNMYARFVSKNEVIENTSANKIINDISNIYRDYWRTELLKKNPKNRTDTALYIALTNYILSNQLTSLSQDSLSKNIKDDSELKKIIEAQRFKADFKFRNGFQELFIWNKETIKDYEVTLPKDTINTKVIFIEEFHLTGYDDYATCGKTQVGGWAIKESATLYCNNNNGSGYDIDSEKFRVSYLKHESLHFTDLNEYPNLSSADLEYRAKVIELMYCTEETVYDRIVEFIIGANNTDRSHSHPYANYILIENLSKLIFNSEFNSDINQWKKISVDKINNAASSLYESSENVLQKDNSLNKII